MVVIAKKDMISLNIGSSLIRKGGGGGCVCVWGGGGSWYINRASIAQMHLQQLRRPQMIKCKD